MSKKLLISDLDARFCRELLVDNSRSAAYRRAGGKAKNATQAAYAILTKAEVQDFFYELKQQQAEDFRDHAQMLRDTLADMITADPADVISDDGSFKPFSEWPLAWRRMLNGFEITELFVGRGEDRKKIGELKKLKLIDRAKVLLMLGNHVSVNAFQETINHTGKVDLAERITRSRKRAGS